MWVFDQCKTDEELSPEIRKLNNMFISMASDTEKVLELFSQLIKDDELLEDWLYFNEYIIMKCVLGFQSVINSL